MRVAILGAGISGLAAGLVLEKNGVNPDIYEQNSFIADHLSHVGVVLNMAYRRVTKEPLKYLNSLLSIELAPLETINNLIIHSRTSKATITNELIGYSFIIGQEPASVLNQLFSNIKNCKFLFEQRQSIEYLRRNYDYVIVSTGSRSEDYVADNYLKDWRQYLVAHTRVAKLSGSFEPNTAVVWGNKEILKNGYAFLAPFSSRIASLYVTIPHISDWNEMNQCWKAFLLKEQLLEKATLLGTYERTHVCAYSSSSTWENCLFTGDQGCFLDPFLGLGGATAVASGAMAAKAILENKNYDRLVKEYKKVINVMSNVRNFYDSIDDKTFDTIVSYEDNSILKKLIYGANVDWLKYGALTVGPFVKQEKSPNFHETPSSPSN